ncbi:MAG: hypothetical protein ABEJ57_06735 [Halobacteriaceae archaeon]
MGQYETVADLSLSITTTDRTRQSLATAAGFDRVTTTVTLGGDGTTGRGEDVTYDTDAHAAWADAPSLENTLAGDWTLDSFCSHLDGVDLFPTRDPPGPSARRYRRWALESAALDLALTQADHTLATVFDREAAPTRFVVSSRVTDGDTTRVQALLDTHPDTRFKLDATAAWRPAVVEDLAATGAVDVIDLKGQYTDPDVREPIDPVLYDRVISGFPDAIIEDPGVDDTVEELLAAHRDRLSWDAPITGIDTIEDRPWPPTWLNVKPSRFGTLQTLFGVLEYADRHDIRLYGGGQFELGIGRRQIQALAAVFYPDAPNDIAPTQYHAPTVRTDAPTSPLPPPSAPGFGR